MNEDYSLIPRPLPLREKGSLGSKLERTLEAWQLSVYSPFYDHTHSMVLQLHVCI